MNNLRGKVALITGATSGIGFAVAQMLLELGVQIFAVGRNVVNLGELAQKWGDQLNIVQCDVSNEQDILRLGGRIAEQPIAILIHSAGIFISRSTENMSLTDFDLQFRVNLRAPFLLTQLLLPTLKAHQGQIVFVNSSVSLQPTKSGLGVYAGTKLALKAFADSLRCEVNESEVKVISIYPGKTSSPMQATIHKTEEIQYLPDTLLQPKDVATTIVNALLASKTAEVTDLTIRPFIKS